MQEDFQRTAHSSHQITCIVSNWHYSMFICSAVWTSTENESEMRWVHTPTRKKTTNHTELSLQVTQNGLPIRFLRLNAALPAFYYLCKLCQKHFLNQHSINKQNLTFQACQNLTFQPRVLLSQFHVPFFKSLDHKMFIRFHILLTWTHTVQPQNKFMTNHFNLLCQTTQITDIIVMILTIPLANCFIGICDFINNNSVVFNDSNNKNKL